MKPTFFDSPDDFRTWLAEHHATKSELVLGFRKAKAGPVTFTQKQAVLEALCFGWIDGAMLSLGDDAYQVRFTPRKAKSRWSAVNVASAKKLIEEKRMRAPGLAAFEARQADKAGYSFEEAPRSFDAASEKTFRANAKAWKWYAAQPPSYHRVAVHWVTSAKKDETRATRLATLIACASEGKPAPPFAYGKARR